MQNTTMLDLYIQLLLLLKANKGISIVKLILNKKSNNQYLYIKIILIS